MNGANHFYFLVKSQWRHSLSLSRYLAAQKCTAPFTFHLNGATDVGRCFDQFTIPMSILGSIEAQLGQGMVQTDWKVLPYIYGVSERFYPIESLGHLKKHSASRQIKNLSEIP